MLCVIFFFTLKIIVESEDSKKNLKKETQIIGIRLVDKISTCVTGCYLFHWFSETLPYSACNDISLLG